MRKAQSIAFPPRWMPGQVDMLGLYFSVTDRYMKTKLAYLVLAGAALVSSNNAFAILRVAIARADIA